METKKFDPGQPLAHSYSSAIARQVKAQSNARQFDSTQSVLKSGLAPAPHHATLTSAPTSCREKTVANNAWRIATCK